MKPNVIPTVSALLLSVVIFAMPLAEAGKLKPTMKEMRLHYKAALDTSDPERFNKEIGLFIEELQVAREFNFSPERKVLSLEGLDRVKVIVESMPPATTENLAQLQSELQQLDQLRKEYHKKVKPGVLDLLIDTIKESLGFN